MKTTSWIPLSWFDFKSKDLFKLVPISSVDSFKNISNYITDHGVQRYVDEGNLNVGDKLYFGIDPKCVDNNNNPAILYFKENMKSKEMNTFVETLIYESYDNWRTKFYDYFQYKSQGIYY